MRRAPWAWVMGAALLAAAQHARAAPLASLSIIDAGNQALTRKLRAESAYAGFTSVDAVAGAGQSGTPPEPVAVIRVLSPSRVELRVASLDGRVDTIELVRADGEGDSFALRVIEQLRASLVDLGWQVPPERSPPVPASASPASATSGSAIQDDGPPGVAMEALSGAARPASGAALPTSDAESPRFDAAEVAASPAVLWFDAGLAAYWAAGGLGVAPHVLLGLRGSYDARWGASVTALLPLASDDVVAPEGLARLSWSLFAAAVDHELPLPAPWSASAGVGAGLLVVGVRGDAQPDFEGRRQRLFSGAYFVELCAGGQLASWLALRATLLAGLNAPRPAFEFDTREVASLGRFFGVLGVSADLGLILAPSGPP